jgi:hypothetical protein
MHNRLLVTLGAPAEAGSEWVRDDVFDRLTKDDSFCGEPGRFGAPLCDWFFIGGPLQRDTRPDPHRRGVP